MLSHNNAGSCRADYPDFISIGYVLAPEVPDSFFENRGRTPVASPVIFVGRNQVGGEVEMLLESQVPADSHQADTHSTAILFRDRSI